MKIKHSFKVDYVSFEYVKKQIDQIIEKHPDLTYEDFHFDTEYYYEDTAYPVVSYTLPETEEERKARLEKEAALRESREKYERQQYEMLKKKFEGGSK